MFYSAISDEGHGFFFTMISRSFLIYLAVVLHVIFSPLDLFAISDNTKEQSSLSKRYDEAKFYYNQLQTKSNLSASGENWLKGTRNFRRIYLSSPKSELAPACLFMLGRVYGGMHDRFHNSIDLEEAISYFKDITRLFPQHRLADDGYFALAQLRIFFS